MTKFIGRQNELDRLKSLTRKRSASLVVIRGRRRVGKSRLTEEFAHSFEKAYFFSGLAPEEDLAPNAQKDEFLRLMLKQKLPCRRSEDWGDLFSDLAENTQQERILIVLDEITWMAKNDKLFLPKLKNVWDLDFKKNPQLILILSGSNSAWIEKNILSSTGFFGRVSHRVYLEELPLSDCNTFWQPNEAHISAYEKFKILSITGGIPRYLEEIDPALPAEENIKKLCFQPEGLLFNEFDEIFHDLFERYSDHYKNLIQQIAQGHTTLETISNALNRVSGGDLTRDLKELCKDGFIKRDYVWNLQTKKPSKINQYRISDNYLRFYLKHIEPNKQQIAQNTMQDLPSGWLTIMGLQFENLVLNNPHKLFELLHIPPNEIIMAKPYWQPKTKQQASCQIDLLIQCKFDTLYICEIKFSHNILDNGVIKEVSQKIKKLKRAKSFSCRPVLIHVNGVNESIPDAGFFAAIIDFGQLLQ